MMAISNAGISRDSFPVAWSIVVAASLVSACLPGAGSGLMRVVGALAALALLAAPALAYWAGAKRFGASYAWHEQLLIELCVVLAVTLSVAATVPQARF